MPHNQPAIQALILKGSTLKRLPLMIPTLYFNKRIFNRAMLLISGLALMLGSLSAHSQPVTFNFENVDIRVVISTVSELTGKNFVVSNKVSGKVTVISSKPLSSKEIYQVFLSVLEVHGYSAVPSGTVIKIVRSIKAKRGAIPTSGDLSGNQMVTQVVHIKNVSALKLTPILRPLMHAHGHLSAYSPTNTLIITDRANIIKKLINIIKRIDKVGNSEVDIVPLRHASAAEVVRILNFLNRSYYKGRNAKQQVRVAADARTNSVLVSGEQSSRLRMRTIISHMDTPLHTGGNTHVIYLKFVKSKDLVPILKGISNTIRSKKTKGKVTSQSAKQVNIQADKRTNSIIVTAPPDTFRSLKQVIDRLDIRRAQVLVEAIIAEVSVDKARELGVQWFIGNSKNGAGAATNFSGSSAGGIGNFANSVRNRQVPNLADGLNLVLGRLTGGGTSVAVLLNALRADTKTNILSTPSIVTLDNQKAEIVVGQNVPFVTGSFTNNGSGASGSNGSVNPFQTIRRQDVGITLRVTPQINHGNSIQLEIDQEVSSIRPSANSGATDIITNKRSIKTTVTVENGQVIILGGLIDTRLVQLNQKVPVLGSIPLLGRLFRYKKTTKEKRNLMVFLRPVILKSKHIRNAVTNSKYQSIRSQQLLLRARGAYGLLRSETPMLNKDIKNITNIPVPVDNLPQDKAATGNKQSTLQSNKVNSGMHKPVTTTNSNPVIRPRKVKINTSAKDDNKAEEYEGD